MTESKINYDQEEEEEVEDGDHNKDKSLREKIDAGLYKNDIEDKSFNNGIFEEHSDEILDDLRQEASTMMQHKKEKEKVAYDSLCELEEGMKRSLTRMKSQNSMRRERTLHRSSRTHLSCQ